MRLLPTLLWIGLVGTTVGCERFDLEGEFVGDPCVEQQVHSFVPAAGSVEGYIDGPVWLDLRCSGRGSGLGVTRSDGRSQRGTVSLHHDERQVRWRPMERLNPQTQYLVHYESADGVLDWAFTTNGVGSPTDNRLNGAGFAIHLSDGELLDPPGLADALLPALSRGFFPVLQFSGDPGGPEGTAPARLGAREDSSAGSAQDLSMRTWSTSAQWADPLFEIGPLTLVWPLQDFDFILEDARLGGGISRDLAWGAGFSLEGLWDTRPSEGHLGDGDTACERAATAGSECTECSDGVRSCLRFEIVLARAEGWSGTLVDVD